MGVINMLTLLLIDNVFGTGSLNKCVMAAEQLLLVKDEGAIARPIMGWGR